MTVNGTDPVNPLRGEAGLTLGGRTLRLRPTFAALVAAEQELGSLFALIERAGRGQLTAADMAALFWHCLAEKPEGMTRENFSEALVREGLAKALPSFRALATAALGGQPEIPGEGP